VKLKLLFILLLIAPLSLLMKSSFSDDKARETQLDVAEAAHRLHCMFNSDGTYYRYQFGNMVEEKDHWGRNLRVDYSKTASQEILTVRSAGPDFKFFTLDDIVRKRSTDIINLYGTYPDYVSIQKVN
jgi:outer membrane usher protein FimD/PapC